MSDDLRMICMSENENYIMKIEIFILNDYLKSENILNEQNIIVFKNEK